MIDVARDGACITFRLSRPEKANALTKDMLLSLAEAVEEANEDKTVKVLILTGTGKVFSAGADLDAAAAGLATDPVWERLSGALAFSPCLTLAALNGTAAGGALGMVLACDLRTASPAAKIFYPVMKLGFLPQPSDPPRLKALVGSARAKQILLAGARVEAQELKTWGLIDVLSEEPLTAARELAADALGADRAHIAAIKSLIR